MQGLVGQEKAVGHFREMEHNQPSHGDIKQYGALADMQAGMELEHGGQK